jgi:subtilisin family serine protease
MFRAACGSDLYGHGTHVAGIVGSKTYGVAKKVSLHDVKVLDQYGGGTWSGVIAGVDYVAKIKKRNPRRKIIINMSLGGFRNRPMNKAVRAAARAKVVVVVSAGNYDDNACNYSPSSASGALVVGSFDEFNYRSWFSNWGSCVDIFAPGSDVLSLDSNGGTVTYSGTSMASPHVAGVAALYLQAGRKIRSVVTDAMRKQLFDVKGSTNRRLSTYRLH